jgi:hypothetical protein
MGLFRRLFGHREPKGQEIAVAPGNLGPASAGFVAFRTEVRDDGDELELSGDWLKDIWSRTEKVKVMKRGDVKAFFTQGRLPYALPNNDGYRRNIDERDDGQATLRLHWTLIYMHHPDPNMLAQALEATAPLTQLGPAVELAYLVTHGDRRIEEVAIGSFWRGLDESGFRIFFNALGSCGTLPSGIDQQRAKWAVRRIDAACPSDCPSSKKDKFQQIAKESFGPNVLKGGPSRPARRQAARVRYKEKTHTTNPFGQTNTYEVYTADSKAAALEFLETKRVTKALYFIVVETPEGNWCKDKMGMYQE